MDSQLGGFIVSRAITAFEGDVVDETASGVRCGQRVGEGGEGAWVIAPGCWERPRLGSLWFLDC